MKLKLYILYFSIFIVLIVSFLLYHRKNYLENMRYNQETSYDMGTYDNISRLKEHAGKKKIVLVGGSSLGFSVSAKILSRELDILVLNLGVHAGYGRNNIWNIYKKYLDPKTDIIVLSPEYDIMGDPAYNKTLTYCQMSLLQEKTYKEELECLPTMISILIKNRKQKKKKKEDTIYGRSSFNTYGDVTGHYSSNETLETIGKEQLVQRKRIPRKDVDEYYRFVQEAIINKGFKVIYIPTIIPKTVCGKNTKELVNIQNILLEKFGMVSRANASTLCYPDRLFYDTGYHMTYKGVLEKTALFKKNIEAEGYR